MKTVFKIKVNYKSGISEVFECLSFKVKQGDVTWEAFGDVKPLLMNYHEAVESVWQISHREVE